MSRSYDTATRIMIEGANEGTKARRANRRSCDHQVVVVVAFIVLVNHVEVVDDQS